MTAGIHALDRLLVLMGGEVASVNAMTGAFFHQQDVDDAAFIGLRFKDGRIVQVSSIGFRNGATSSSLDLICGDATISIDFGGDMRIGRNGQWSTVRLEPESDPALAAIQRQWSAFLQSIRDKTPTSVSGLYGRHVVAAIEAARQSNQARKEIQIEDAQNDR